MDDDPKTGPGDGTDSKPGERTPSSVKSGGDLTQTEMDKAITIGMRKGVDKGRKEMITELLADLGVESLDHLKEALKKGKSAIEKIDTSKGKYEQMIEDLRNDYTSKEKALRSELEPLIKEASQYIKKNQEREVFTSLRIKDPEVMRAMMLLHEPEEGETLEDHVKRIVKLKPSLADPDKNPLNPGSQLGDPGVKPQTRIEELAQRFGRYQKRTGKVPEKTE